MSSADQIFDVFRAANPERDIDTLHARRPPVDTYLARLSGAEVVVDLPTAPPQPRRLRWAVAAVAVIGALVLGGWFLTRSRTTVDQQPIETIDEDELVEREAVAAAQAWFDAANAGDVEAMVAVSDPAAAELADRRQIEWLGAFAAEGYGIDVGACRMNPAAFPVTVECAITLSDPVAVELGVAELTAPFRFSDGLLAWVPWADGDLGSLNEAYAEYLVAFEPAAYVAVCQPAAYELGSVVANRNLALTGECGELAAPQAEQVVEWLRAGRPAP